jgi:hypothetical protein
VIEKIRRALTGAASQPDETSRSFNPMTYHWRCECGAHSRGADIKADTEYNAQRHMWSKGVGHPMPEVYSTEE